MSTPPTLDSVIWLLSKKTWQKFSKWQLLPHALSVHPNSSFFFFPFLHVGQIEPFFGRTFLFNNSFFFYCFCFFLSRVTFFHFLLRFLALCVRQPPWSRRHCILPSTTFPPPTPHDLSPSLLLRLLSFLPLPLCFSWLWLSFGALRCAVYSATDS